MILAMQAELLAKLKNIFGKKCRQVELMPTLTGKKLVEHFAVNAPAIYISPINGKGEGDAARHNFGILVVTKNARSTAALVGDGQEIGLYQLMDAVLKLTSGYLAGWSWLGYSFPDDDSIFSAGIALGVINVSVSTSCTVDSNFMGFIGEELDDFLGLTAYVDVEPFTSTEIHEQWLAGEETPSAPDAVVIINLEQ